MKETVVTFPVFSDWKSALQKCRLGRCWSVTAETVEENPQPSSSVVNDMLAVSSAHLNVFTKLRQ